MVRREHQSSRLSCCHLLTSFSIPLTPPMKTSREQLRTMILAAAPSANSAQTEIALQGVSSTWQIDREWLADVGVPHGSRAELLQALRTESIRHALDCDLNTLHPILRGAVTRLAAGGRIEQGFDVAEVALRLAVAALLDVYLQSSQRIPSIDRAIRFHFQRPTMGHLIAIIRALSANSRAASARERVAVEFMEARQRGAAGKQSQREVFDDLLQQRNRWAHSIGLERTDGYLGNFGSGGGQASLIEYVLEALANWPALLGLRAPLCVSAGLESQRGDSESGLLAAWDPTKEPIHYLGGSCQWKSSEGEWQEWQSMLRRNGLSEIPPEDLTNDWILRRHRWSKPVWVPNAGSIDEECQAHARRLRLLTRASTADPYFSAAIACGCSDGDTFLVRPFDRVPPELKLNDLLGLASTPKAARLSESALSALKLIRILLIDPTLEAIERWEQLSESMGGFGISSIFRKRHDNTVPDVSLPTRHAERFLDALRSSGIAISSSVGPIEPSAPILNLIEEAEVGAEGGEREWRKGLKAAIHARGAHEIGAVAASVLLGKRLDSDDESAVELLSRGIVIYGADDRLEARTETIMDALELLAIENCSRHIWPELLGSLEAGSKPERARTRTREVELRGLKVPPGHVATELAAVHFLDRDKLPQTASTCVEVMALFADWRQPRDAERLVEQWAASRSARAPEVTELVPHVRRYCSGPFTIAWLRSLVDRGEASPSLLHQLAGVMRDSEVSEDLREALSLYGKVLGTNGISDEQRVRSLLGRAEALAKLHANDGQVQLEASGLIEEALRLARAVGRTALVAECLHRAAFLSDRMKDARTAIAKCHEALAYTPPGSNDRLRVRVLNTLALALRREGQFGEAVMHHREEIELKRRLGDRLGLQKGLVSFALSLRASNQPAAARKCAIEACELAECFGDISGLRMAVGQLRKLLEPDDEWARRQLERWSSMIEDHHGRIQ